MNTNDPRSTSRPNLKQVHHGSQEKIFQVLPEDTWQNFHTPHSENALLWNLVYPLCQPTISLRSFLEITPLWGIPATRQIQDDALTPYFWGFDVSGRRFPTLDRTLVLVDGVGSKMEIDLILRGEQNIMVVEVKNRGRPGRCGRYHMARCPEIHQTPEDDLGGCQYWSEGNPAFSDVLEFGPRPDPDAISPPCNKHYQLARTLLIGWALAQQFDMQLGVWLILPRQRWSGVRRTWLDFANRIRSPDIWRQLRVIAWEDIQGLTR